MRVNKEYARTALFAILFAAIAFWVMDCCANRVLKKSIRPSTAELGYTF